MADVTLSDGRELTFDLNKVTRKEYADLVSGKLTNEQDDEIVGKACGLTSEQVSKLGYLDWRKAAQAFFKKAREPLADPNSLSVPS